MPTGYRAVPLTNAAMPETATPSATACLIAEHANAATRPAHWLYSAPILLLEAILVITWSSGFVGTRYSIDYAPALLVVFWRCIVVSLILLPWALQSIRRASGAVLLRHGAIGLLSMAGYLAGVVKGIEYGVPAGLAALFADLLPIGTTVLAAVALRQRHHARVWAGLAIGLLGVVLVTHDALALGDASLWAYGLPLLGMFSLAIATLWQQRSYSSSSLGLVANLWIQCAASALALGALVSAQGSLAPIPSTGFAISVAWTAGMSTLGGYGLYWLCLQRTSPTRVASVLYLSPAVTLVWAWAAFGEPLSWIMAVGTAVCVFGIWMVTHAEAKDREFQAKKTKGARLAK